MPVYIISPPYITIFITLVVTAVVLILKLPRFDKAMFLLGVFAVSLYIVLVFTKDNLPKLSFFILWFFLVMLFILVRVHRSRVKERLALERKETSRKANEVMDAMRLKKEQQARPQ